MKVVLVRSIFIASVHAPKSVCIEAVSKNKSIARSMCLRAYASYLRSL